MGVYDPVGVEERRRKAALKMKCTQERIVCLGQHIQGVQMRSKERASCTFSKWSLTKSLEILKERQVERQTISQLAEGTVMQPLRLPGTQSPACVPAQSLCPSALAQGIMDSVALLSPSAHSTQRLSHGLK